MTQFVRMKFWTPCRR
uniref:Uncharacterized protein n=1 Tax=Anguilla anguilla TaxID=7936 RepID=A0A0E9VV61_ANGAN